MIEERFYLVDENEKLIIIEKINYNGIDYMLLKNSTKAEVKIAYEYNMKLFYINESDDDYQIISNMLFNKLKEELSAL